MNLVTVLVPKPAWRSLPCPIFNAMWVSKYANRATRMSTPHSPVVATATSSEFNMCNKAEAVTFGNIISGLIVVIVSVGAVPMHNGSAKTLLSGIAPTALGIDTQLRVSVARASNGQQVAAAIDAVLADVHHLGLTEADAFASEAAVELLLPLEPSRAEMLANSMDGEARDMSHRERAFSVVVNYWSMHDMQHATATARRVLIARRVISLPELPGILRYLRQRMCELLVSCTVVKSRQSAPLRLLHRTFGKCSKARSL